MTAGSNSQNRICSRNVILSQSRVILSVTMNLAFSAQDKLREESQSSKKQQIAFGAFPDFFFTGPGRVAANTMNKLIILASASPRRREPLRQVGLSFKAAPAPVDERGLDGERAGTYSPPVAGGKG